MDDTYKKFNDGRFRLCQELRTNGFYFKQHLEHQNKFGQQYSVVQNEQQSVQKQLKAAGIDTNSKKYKAALSEMMKNGTVQCLQMFRQLRT